VVSVGCGCANDRNSKDFVEKTTIREGRKTKV
jgi:hypothetical protein